MTRECTESERALVTTEPAALAPVQQIGRMGGRVVGSVWRSEREYDKGLGRV